MKVEFDSRLKAKLVAYLGFKNGRSCYLKGKRLEEELFIQEKLEELKNAPITPRNIRRQIFLLLVLSEMKRDEDFISYRIEAKELGNKLSQLGEENPYPFFVKILNKVTKEPSTGNLGDFNVCPNQPVEDCLLRKNEFGFWERIDLALEALDLTPSEKEIFQNYLGLSIKKIVN